MFPALAAKITEQVRAFFAGGYKSQNKRYHVDFKGNDAPPASLEPPELARMTARNQNSNLSNLVGAENRYYYGWAPSVLAEAVLNTRHGRWSGSCMEMSCLSAYRVCEEGLAPVDRVYIAKLAPPADHMFCVVVFPEITDKRLMKFDSVKALTQAQGAAGWTILDPWLNVTCRPRSYLNLAGVRLDEWGAGGKRIFWTHGQQKAGWYPPHGEYMQRFAQATLTLVPYY
jgi:hypothetical protein